MLQFFEPTAVNMAKDCFSACVLQDARCLEKDPASWAPDGDGTMKEVQQFVWDSGVAVAIL